jgi:Fe-S oxidoreductase/predicted DNA-binding transcriptional regulator YafY
MGRGMSKASRLQHLEEILLNSSRGHTIKELADILEVHRTTVWRDINELSLEAPVQECENRYFIDRKEYLSSIRLSRGESLMLYLAIRRMIRQQSTMPPMMLMAMEKLSLALRHPSSVELAESIQGLQKGHLSRAEQSQVWEVLVRGWIERITVRITYQEIRSSVVEEFEVQPYQFEPAAQGESVFVIGRCLAQDAVTTFRVDRILSASLTTKRFARPKDIVVDSMLRHLWGIWHGNELTRVRLQFKDPEVAEHIRKVIWLPSQKLRDLEAGGVEWSSRVPDVLELIPWIQSWGQECEVIEPDDLKEKMTEVEKNHGGATMTVLDTPRTLTFSESFYLSLQEILDGERIKACLQCSSCSGICPLAYAMEYHPRKIISAIRAGVFDVVMETDSVWMCVSCYACTEVCPAMIPLTDGLMTRTKEEMILAGNVPTELQDALENSQRYGNPLGESPRKRAEWVKGLEPEVTIMAKAERPVDVLWFVGDYSSYHPRVQKISAAFHKILTALKVNFGILGPEESSDGDSQRMAGEKGLFEMLALKNGKAFSKYQFNEIITTDPHAYNALKNEYPKVGISYPVRHYTEFLVDRMDDLKPLLKKELKATVTFHDPCYLGRVNGIYEEPRMLISAIPGVELVEMSHNRENSLCCGGGGGGMWLDGFQWEKTHTRLSEWRVREAMEASGTGVDVRKPPLQEKRNRGRQAEEEKLPAKRILAGACPYETPRFEDAAKMVEGASHLEIKDIAELLVEAMAD